MDGIGRNDDFLALAGNSLDAAAIAARLSRTLFLQVSPALLLESGTPARLAEALGTLPMDPEIAAALEEAENAAEGHTGVSSP